MSDQDDLAKIASSSSALAPEDVARIALLFPMRKDDDEGLWLSERTRIRDQASADTCASAALTTAIEHAYGIPLSEAFIDYNLKRDRGDASGGALLGELARSVGQHGICLRGLYAGGEPSDDAVRDASIRIPAIVPLLAHDDDLAVRILELLHDDRKVAFGCPVDRSFLEYRPWVAEAYEPDPFPFAARAAAPRAASGVFASTKVFDAPEHIISDHAMCVVGHRAADDAFLVQSSWGTSWGLAGYAWISRRYLTMWGAAGFCYVARGDE